MFRSKVLEVGLILLMSLLMVCAFAPPPRAAERGPIIEDRTSAIKIGYAILSCHYPIVAKPAKTQATLKNGVWKVMFTNKVPGLGGAYEIRLRKYDGAVVYMVGYR